MNKPWIPHPTILSGEYAELVPLEEKHFEELYLAASDKLLWELVPVNGFERETFYEVYTTALEERTKGNQYPFVIYDKLSGKIIGSTRLFEIFEKDKKLEIGWTWITRNHWGTAINPECKLLLLSFCFEKLGARRVQLKTKDNNIRSRKAIEKIGGFFEGILRKDRIQADGTSRNAAYYSILDDEWDRVKKKLHSLVSAAAKPSIR